MLNIRHFWNTIKSYFMLFNEPSKLKGIPYSKVSYSVNLWIFDAVEILAILNNILKKQKNYSYVNFSDPKVHNAALIKWI